MNEHTGLRENVLRHGDILTVLRTDECVIDLAFNDLGGITLGVTLRPGTVEAYSRTIPVVFEDQPARLAVVEVAQLFTAKHRYDRLMQLVEALDNATEQESSHE